MLVPRALVANSEPMRSRFPETPVVSYSQRVSTWLGASGSLRWGLSCALLAVTACTFSKPEAGDSLSSCQQDMDCTNTGICDILSGVCVQCLPDRLDACMGSTPACGASNLCEACDSHRDCTSDACLPNGTCAATEEVVHLRQGGTSPDGNCTQATPCGALDNAIAQAMTTTRPYVRVIGTISNAFGVVNGKQLTFLGEKDSIGSTLRGIQMGGGNEPTLLTVGNNAKVELHNINLLEADGAGVLVNGTDATLVLNRSKISAADEEGILISNGAAIVSESEISACGGLGGGARRGINLTNGELTISRSIIADNGGGGIVVSDGTKFTIANSFIVGNRLNGGVNLGTPYAGSRFEFNTIVDNQDGGNSTDAGGVFCDQVGVVFSNNIIFRNTGGPGGIAQTFGSCTYGSSYLASGAGSGDASLMFLKDTFPRDYHLTAASPSTVRDVPGVVCTGMKDVDGEARPQNGACDLGADEYKAP